MTEIAKEIIRQQVNYFIPGQKGWPEHVGNCISAEICPICGFNLYSYQRIATKGSREPIKYGCPNCEWQGQAQS